MRTAGHCRLSFSFSVLFFLIRPLPQLCHLRTNYSFNITFSFFIQPQSPISLFYLDRFYSVAQASLLLAPTLPLTHLSIFTRTYQIHHRCRQQQQKQKRQL
ncbi:hypothetical protein BX661DRAFT_71846 [Kickxella alabastrina]|uniref:uncharacterized protein n=1 Tax=Kickxella alabastrina TaxID=61397 RepID=UPI00221FB931|nr:uncharacterized protein BX661DRAFT_71846 [Kickxella alabastrina]KAI7833249.1 hypothetical protein BX661DRAFT_71846 [Kickxella alabastrina]